MKGIRLCPLLIVFILAFSFRFYKLSSYPVSLSIDEVGFGYNAYSIIKTGRDEWGMKMPLVFRAIGDYKPAIDIYLTVPSVYLFGLTEFGVRFPTALLGALTAVIFVMILFEFGLSRPASILGGLWLAVNPWHVHFSRGNFEAIIALFFLLVGVWSLLRWNKSMKNRYLSLSVMAFALSVWSYNAERLFSPLLFLILSFLLRGNLRVIIRNPKLLIAPLVILLIFITPYFYLGFFTEAIRSRPLSTSIFREAGLMDSLHRGTYVNWIERLLDNDIYLIFRHWAGKYLNYFDLRFWFWKGMGYTQPGDPDLGLFYIVDVIPILSGTYLVFSSKNKLFRAIAVTWLFLGPLPASLTMNEQHTIRSLTWLPFFGFAYASSIEFVIKNVRRLRTISVVYFALLAVNIAYFANLYFVHYPKYYSEYWQYGYKEIALYACGHIDEYNEVIITDTFGSLGPLNTGIPYAYVLFYCQYDPNTFLANGRRISKISFRRPDWPNDSLQKNRLLIGSPWDLDIQEIPMEAIIRVTYFKNKQRSFIYADTR
ncbi:MAG: hypothetical protein UV74_C0013G0367 [Candidatus Woesebacteria bacterium GW2011_GWB1_43_14]|uniref:Glycosyltransferase RgtA/B/C/D-like domain-containing protein n=1 Tax=Candidatus Woesebacteria bacterium GW2011_GWB1_43_14 TaxID=1618578 RepID=A0A0G1DHA9_9BACT|nr:MAG: hypothetical protein UT21_C0001G0077 [Candidatus Woesebacteria bacterium GW2011_GWA1_39_11b]KKS78337.1 MAG: hypothetical protein UV51_C0001G0053 [Candidatus Woesebacteria bacterium GW2011_GWC1_42_9]KKS97245.1 MAG: hypothetical protein UV74_C0013G0367 [Candidatus Woesebacteria bacterium GW2011_GWB1_43_14]